MAGPSPRNPYVQWYQQHKTLVWGTTAAAVTLYATYKAATIATATEGGGTRRQQRPLSSFRRLFNTLQNYSSAASSFADIAALVSGDLRSFLTSDTAELPQSLCQLSKLLQAKELQETIATVTASVVRGAATAIQGQESAGPPLVDTVIEAMLSERGRGLVGMAVGVATRNATVAFCEFMDRRLDALSGSGSGLGIKDLLDMLSSEQGEKLLTLLLTKSIRTAVASYVESTTGYNLYDDMLASIAKQDHRDALTDLLARVAASFCRELVVSYRRSSTASAAPGACVNAVNHATAKYASNREGCSVSMSGTAPACFSSGVASVAACDGLTSADGSHVGPPTPPPVIKSNGQLSSNQHARPAQGTLQLHKQHSVNGLAGAAGGGANASAGSLGRTLLAQAQAAPPWLRQVVELVRERDVRSLAVDVVKSASREATRGAVEGLLQSSGVGCSRDAGAGGSGSGVLMLPSGAMGYKLYVLATLAVSMCMYALSPRVMLV